jgi:hypothetical protein
MSTIIFGKSIPVMQHIYFDATYYLCKIFIFMQSIYLFKYISIALFCFHFFGVVHILDVS